MTDQDSFLDSGDSELEEHIAIRPTSETVMYPCQSPLRRSVRQLTRRRLCEMDSEPPRSSLETESVEFCSAMGI